MYHERQKWSLCGVHAVNNLLQEPHFDKSSFDRVCEELAPTSFKFWNPHRSALGLGNYDVNVLMVVLEQQRGYHVQWHDRRHDITRQVLEDYYAYYYDTTTTTSNATAANGNNNRKEDDPSATTAAAITTSTTTCGIVVNLPSNKIWAKLTKGRHWLTLLWKPDALEWYNLDSDLKEPQLIGDMEDCVKLLQGWKHQTNNDCHILLVRKLE